MLSIPADGVTLLCGPVYHSAQWAFSYLPLIAGSTVVMRQRFDPAEVLELIDRHAVTNVHLVPTQFHPPAEPRRRDAAALQRRAA